MELKYIRGKLENRRAEVLGVTSNYAVLLPLVHVKDEVHVLFQVRAKDLDVQPGEISFPGGGVEAGETFKEAAVRETYEELRIDKQNIKIIGELDYMVSPYNLSIYPYVGILQNTDIQKINFNKDEVDNIFCVPLTFFLKNEPIIHQTTLKTIPDDNFPFHLIPKGKNYNWRIGRYPVPFYFYNDYIIWGITARITKNFIDILKKE